jgi:hypothetical protein
MKSHPDIQNRKQETVWDKLGQQLVRHEVELAEELERARVALAEQGKVESILSNSKNVGWYPSCCFDLRPILVSRKAVMQAKGVVVPADYRQPDLWILSDACGPFIRSCYAPVSPQVSRYWQSGFVFLDDHRTRIEFTGCVPLPGLRLRGHNTQLCDGISYFLTVSVTCHIGEKYSMNLLFLNADDARVYEFICDRQLKQTHLAWGGGFCSEFVMDLYHNQARVWELGAKWAFCEQHLNGYRDCGGRLGICTGNQPVPLRARE